MGYSPLLLFRLLQIYFPWYVHELKFVEFIDNFMFRAGIYLSKKPLLTSDNCTMSTCITITCSLRILNKLIGADDNGTQVQLKFIHSFIPAISIAPLQVLYYSEALPTTARILYQSFTPKRPGNCR